SKKVALAGTRGANRVPQHVNTYVDDVNNNLFATHMPRISIAAYNASARSKAAADFVCDGTDDQEEINRAIQELTGGSPISPRIGGGIVLSEGRFNISDTIVVDRGIHLEGVSSQATELYLVSGSNCNMIEIGPNSDGNPHALNIFERFKMNGNYTGNTGTVWAIVQKDETAGGIDIRFFDIWFDSISTGAIYLVGYWNHHIEWCTFEHITGTAIHFAPATTIEYPSLVHINHNMAMVVENFITQDTGAQPKKINIIANHIKASKDVVDLAAWYVDCSHNYIECVCDANNTYNVWNIDLDKYSTSTICKNITINDNMIVCAANKPKHLLEVKGTQYVQALSFCGNKSWDVPYGAATYAVNIHSTGRSEEIQINDNILYTPGNGIYVDNFYNLYIKNNILSAGSGYHEIVWGSTGGLNPVVVGNKLTRGISGTWPSAAGYEPIVKENLGYVTEAQGTATIVSGTTSIDVSHGLDITPEAGDVVVTPVNTWGSMTSFYVGNYTSTTFTIYANTDPGKDVTFAWFVRKKF
ncbi:MAG: hypothetical protein ACTSRA_12320, partial [Promethearchaeota archaeon]